MSTPSMLTPQGLAADPSALNALRYGVAKGGDRQSVKEAARQFEALFMRELLKSMREATQKSGLMDNDGSALGSDLLDQQFAVQMTGMPGGLSEAIERQLSRQMNPEGAPTEAPVFKPLNRSAVRAVQREAAGIDVAGVPSTVSRVGAASTRQSGFVAQHGEAAAQVASESGIPASFMLGQAGHETGWGRSEIRMKDGSPAFNLFGIKAGANWKGKVAEITTTEYVDGVPRKTVAKFRAYDSYADSFRDYARLISQSPRYGKVMDQLDSAHGFASSLQKAGYATDPQYAHKLGRAINTALSLQRLNS